MYLVKWDLLDFWVNVTGFFSVDWNNFVVALPMYRVSLLLHFRLFEIKFSYIVSSLYGHYHINICCTKFMTSFTGNQQRPINWSGNHMTNIVSRTLLLVQNDHPEQIIEFFDSVFEKAVPESFTFWWNQINRISK